jgi:hypothetical protein
MSSKDVVSPSRNYVAVCNKHNFSGHYFRKFYLPEYDEEYVLEGINKVPLTNNAEVASWYFLNRLDTIASIRGCVTWEDYNDIKETRSRRIDTSSPFRF